MASNVISVRGDDTLSEAIRLLADSHVSGLPVVDSAGRVIGVVSSSDILQAEAETTELSELRRLRAETLVEEVMTRKPLLISPEADLREAAQQMLYAEVHRLFVEAEGTLVGVISQSDIVRAVAGGMLVKAPGAAAGQSTTKPAGAKKKPPARAPKVKRR
jgi:CBS domain-containing protein